jgi:hypothetical protein
MKVDLYLIHSNVQIIDNQVNVRWNTFVCLVVKKKTKSDLE